MRMTAKLQLGGLAAIAGIVLVIAALVLHRPMEAYAVTNPGLDSGNAQVTTVGNDTVLTYKTVGNSTFKAPAGVSNVRVLVVGGGGGGGAGESKAGGDGGGGGGAGEYVHQTSVAVSPGTAVTVTVGNGGNGSQTPQPDGGGTAQNGASGTNSVFGSLTARGGGGGGGNDQAGVNGGSGGGAGGHCTNSSTLTSGGTKTATAPGVGNNGGSSPAGSCTPRGAAGGGGAAAVGSNGSSVNGGRGADGLQNDITGTNSYYAAGGGGGGSSSSGTGASGGAGGGGAGGKGAGGSAATASAATANTGSGGGGGGSNDGTSGYGGKGGSGVVIVRFTTQTINPATPGGVSGLTMWYKADAAGNTNALWKDSSGFGYDMTQSTISKQPTLNGTINFNPAYVFDGTDDVFRMDDQGILGNQPMSAFFAAMSNNAADGWRYFNEFGDDAPSIGFNGRAPELYVRTTNPISYTYTADSSLTPHVFSYVSPNANNQSRIVGVDNNEQSQNVPTGTYTTSSGRTGNSFGSTNGSDGKTWQGPIAEAMYFNRVLTAQERQKINSYLAIKYGTTLNAAYLDSAGTAIYPSDATFKNNIAGIGRDDASALNQKQSKSSAAGDIVTIGHGAIAATNQANSNNFGSDKAFLVWGHNGAATNQNAAVDGGYVRMSRIWKAVRTTAMGTIKVRVPKSAVTQGTNGVMYISTSTTFGASSQRINMTDLGTEYEATVTSLPADVSYFTFGSLAGSDIQFVSKTATNTGGDPISSYTPGESLAYVLKVKNNGPDNAGTVTVVDTMPDDVIPTRATGGGWNCNIATPTVTCTRTALNSGITAPDIIIEADIASNITGDKTNNATASVSNDPNTGNNNASLMLPAAPEADLGITKRHIGTPVGGGQFHYEYTVKNNGPSDVGSFTINDPLPAKTTFDHATGGISCTGTTTLNCTYGSAVADGQTAIFQIYVNVDPSYNPANPPTGDGPLQNTVTVAVPPGTTDPNSANNNAEDTTNVLVETDLTITKAPNAGATAHFVAGQNNVYKIVVGNQGPSATLSGKVFVTDTLESEFSYVSGTGTNWSCVDDDGTVTCTYNAAISPGGFSSDLLLTVAVDPTVKGTVSNSAEVSATTYDGDSADSTATHNTTIDANVDMSIVKDHVGTAFVAGQQEQYTFTVSNAGPAAAEYTITDDLPANVTLVSTEPGSATTCTGTTSIVCDGGWMEPGAPDQVTTINVMVDPSATGTLNNSATVNPVDVTNNTGTGTDGDTVNIEPNADLSITKTPNTDMTAGANATYTFTVHNGGPSNVASYTVTDKLNPNLTLVPGGGCVVTTPDPSGDEVTCTGTGITNGNDGTINMTVTVNPSATPGVSIPNTATVVVPDDTNDPNPNNNNSSVDRNVVASADMQITKSHTGNFTAGSDDNEFTIVATNAGPSDADTFTVTDTLPAGMTYIDAAGTAGIGVTCNNSGLTVTCTSDSGIGAGQSSTITLTVAVEGNIAGNSILTNAVTVASATPDPNTGNNDATDPVTIDSKADLEITKNNMTDFTAGNDEDYNIEVINHGPSDVTGFKVTDTLPSELTFVTTGSDPGCSALGQDVTCNGGALASGDSVNITIRVHVDSGLSTGTVINNTADVETILPTTDPDMSNNSSTDPTDIVDVTDLSIQKNPEGTYVAGETGKFTFTVSNGGPSNTPAGDVQVTDSLPGGMTYDSFTGTGWDCSGSSGQSVSCTYGPSLPVSDTTPVLTVTVNIEATMQGEVVNTGSVLSTFDDSDPADDTSTITVNVGAEADLTATKTVQGSSTLVAGQPVTYRFEVTNDGGPSQANNVTITDDLQGHFAYQSFQNVTGTWDCADNNGTVTCTLPSLAVDDTAAVDVTLEVAEDAPNPVVNAATVTFNGTDPSPSNPSSSNPVDYSADLEVDIEREQKTYHSGDTVNYTYIVKNHGPSAAKDVELVDTIPSGMTITHISATKPGGDSILSAINKAIFPTAHAASNPFSCSMSGQQLTCTAGTLFTGTYNLYVTAHIGDSYTGQLTNTLHISSSTPDPNPNNNNAADTITDIEPGAGLAKTGKNILVGTVAALALLTLAVVLFRYKRVRA